LYRQEFRETASNFIKLLFHCFTIHYNLSVRLRDSLFVLKLG